MKQTLNDVHQQFAEFFPGKVLAPFVYLLSKKLSEGHICLNIDLLADELEGLPVNYQKIIENDKEKLVYEQLVTDENGLQPFILHNRRLYLERYFAYETKILNGILTLIKNGEPLIAGRCATLLTNCELINDLFKGNFSQDEIDWQMAGVLVGVINNFTIITGGPGTGKTTTLAKLLAVLYTIEPNIRVALAAPTGKAAMRMAESLQSARIDAPESVVNRIKALEPVTLHRLLKSVPNSTQFRHNAENPLPEDVIVIDEASMVDVALFAKLMEAVGPHTRLIFLGDKNQLASVEAGSMLGDLCQFEPIINTVPQETAIVLNAVLKLPAAKQSHPLAGHIIELKKSHRFSDTSEIGNLSHAILAGQIEAIKPGSDVTIDHNFNHHLLAAFFAGFETYINEGDITQALQKLNSQRILCAVWEGEQGVTHLNTLVEEYLKSKKLIRITSDFYENRPIMVSRNYYDLGLFNGDTGIIRPDENGNLKAWFSDGKGGVRDVLPHYISEVQTVFAMTIHKSQGSEYDRVLILLPEKGGERLLTRELLYTAVTRAKNSVTIQASHEVMRTTVITSVQRASGIFERFIQSSSTNLNLQ
ncbi:exodeoxyribonuclease V subunit alpha [Mucilaginibacter segetis]|uniref:RecBCD enzyme subunit RecD n=1 Tax=Mucilaginibacter segetis TaxID=2793071 RepID=A0A934UNL9_9SPHI|nr:exodeoxyribonuclease V subunit alpha [Mucilaginibacter segetis]MBK0380047.1 exodeoxyribonuclease V subunit alpha [Mucilaginibacter segetis]